MKWRRLGAALALSALAATTIGTPAWAETPAPTPATATPTPAPTASATATSTPTPTAASTVTPTPTPVAGTTTSSSLTPAAPKPKQPRRKLPLRKGDFGPLISRAQQRLTWLGYSITPATLAAWRYGDTTAEAVRRFQVKFWLKPTGTIDKATWKKLSSVAGKLGRLPKACTEVTTICVDKTQKLLRFVVKGKVVMSADARFGMAGTPTADGTFRVKEKAFDHTSTKFHTWMPRAMFFNGGQAVHFSPYFLRDGYNGGSHGCINIRDMTKVTWLFNHAPLGTRVHVYWS